LTAYAEPRYLPIVLALAGDSTITNDLPAAERAASSSCGSSGSTRVFFRAVAGDTRFVAVFFFAAFLVVFLTVVRLDVAISFTVRVRQRGAS
jgi:hypothetical protein